MSAPLQTILDLFDAAESRMESPGCRAFGVLPSRHAARLLTPLGDHNATLAGLRMYTPYSRAARLLHALIQRLAGLKFARWTPPPLRLSVSGLTELERFVAEVTGEKQPQFAMLLGTPNRLCKLTVQVMRPKGEILGFLKLPLTEEAHERIRHEASALQFLETQTSLAPHLPRLLFAGEWSGIPVVFQSPLSGRPGPVRQGRLHQQFLNNLRSVRQEHKPGHYLVKKVLDAWRQAASLMESDLGPLGEAALECAEHLLEDYPVPCGTIHGDFAPWNTRVSGDRLLVFDWEATRWEAPSWWDEFHFDVQVRALLGGRPREDRSLYGTRSGQGVYVLYLVETLRQAIVDGSDRQAAFRFRQTLIRRVVRMRSHRGWRHQMQVPRPTCEY